MAAGNLAVVPTPDGKLQAGHPAKKNKNKATILDIINDQQTEEMVFALCGALGSISQSVLDSFQTVLEGCGYTCSVEKLSDYIKRSGLLSPNFSALNYAEQIKVLQDTGNRLRETHGNYILAMYAIQEIAKSRKIFGEENHLIAEGEVKAVKRRHVTIIDSLKHDDELHLLRTVYGKMLYLFSVQCPESFRKHRIKKDRALTDTQVAEIIDRDMGQKEEYGQKLSKIIEHSDFYINSSEDNTHVIEKQIERFIHLLLGNVTITPTIGEYAMYIAYATGLRSGCMSRQVGASVVSPDGDIISTGRNDVPKYLGGLYSADDSIDNRCMFRTNKRCKNEENKTKLMEDIRRILTFEGVTTEQINAVFDAIKDNRQLKGIVEYSKSIHAEMDAIVSAARTAHTSLKGCDLYCTTYPCHNCARHIVAAGIRAVYYIEPYDKSFASDLHDDSISFDSTPGHQGKRVLVAPFSGVSPRQYGILFRVDTRKHQGALIPFEKRKARPTNMRYIDPFVFYEAQVVESLRSASVGSDKVGLENSGGEQHV